MKQNSKVDFGKIKTHGPTQRSFKFQANSWHHLFIHWVFGGRICKGHSESSPFSLQKGSTDSELLQLKTK